MSWLQTPTQAVQVDGCDVRYRRLGPASERPLVLLHGGGAHAGWWIDVVPALAEVHDVVVIELSGFGDSDHRESYRPELWADEVAAVIEDVTSGSADVVGHSMGGLVGVYVAARTPALTERLIMIDSPIVKAPNRSVAKSSAGPVKTYATLAEGLANFRLRPRGTTASPETLARVGHQGLGQTGDRWRWKFDPRAVRLFTTAGLAKAITQVECPVGFVYGDRSELTDVSSVDHIAHSLGRPVPRIEVTGAYHHVPIDQPGATVDAIEHLLVELTEELARPGRQTNGVGIGGGSAAR